MDYYRYLGRVLLIATLLVMVFSSAYAEETATAFLDKGLAHIDANQLKEALADLNEVIKLDPSYAQAFLYRGLIHGRVTSIERGIQDLDESIRLDDKNAKAFYLRGSLHVFLNELNPAVKDFTAALDLDSGFDKAYSGRGAAYLYLYKFGSALRDLSVAIELEPDNARAYFHRGVANFHLYELEQSLADFEMAVHLDSTDSKYRFWRAKVKVLFLEGDHVKLDQVVSDLRSYIEDNPDSADGYINLAYALSVGCLLEDAAEHLRTGIALAEENNSYEVTSRDYQRLALYESGVKTICEEFSDE